MFWQKYPLALAVMPWMAGLVLSEFIFRKDKFWFACSTVLLIVSIVFYVLSKRKYRFAVYFTGSLLAFFLVSGIGFGTWHRQENTMEKVRKALPEKVLEVRFRIVKPLRTTPYYRQYAAYVTRINGNFAGFKVLYQIPVDKDFSPDFSKEYVYHPGPKEWKPLPPPRFPFGFDYGKYLRNQGIYFKLISKSPENLSFSGRTFPEGLAELRRKIQHNIEKSVQDTLTYQVMSALLLGERYLLDPEVKQSFIDAGVVHVLAISGLHIGILLFFLRLLFRPIKRQRFLYNVLILGTIGLYAALIDFPPSVTRATMMFGFFQVAWEVKRRVSPYYTLLLAAFFILSVAPNAWKDIGFLLSFGAVFSILTFYPLIKQVYYPENRILQYVIDLLYVSVAAQILLLPLLLLFFHRFSFGFIIANLVVIPFISLILILGFAMIPFWVAGLSFDAVGIVLRQTVGWMIQAIEFISKIRFLVFEKIYFSPLYALALLLGLAAFYMTITSVKRRRIGAIVLIGLSSILILRDNYLRSRKQMIFLSSSKLRPVLSVVRHNKLKLYHDDSLNLFFLSDFYKHFGIKTLEQYAFPRVFRAGDKTCLLLDRPFPDSIVQRPYDILILDNSPKINLDLWLNRTGAEAVVVTGSNYDFMKRLWKNSCARRGIRYADLDRAGYVMLYEK